MNKVAVLGLGYVGLPLAMTMSTKFNTVGFDVNKRRVMELVDGVDKQAQFTREQLIKSTLNITNNDAELTDCNVYIVTVPTPINNDHRPDLNFLLDASKQIASHLKVGDLVVYESTVYPGVTEEECLPILESLSGLTVNVDFGLGYSPERINPGDKERTVTKIQKVTSGSNSFWTEKVDALYSQVITAGTFKAASIKVAEAAKVIENTQRDLNIALINQLAQMFSILDIDTHDVLEAAGTKWNFLPFKPGLVGGHCISVDPYYLCHKAETVGYLPDIILSGRRLNDGMGSFIAGEIIKMMSQNKIAPHNANIVMMGVSFKENCKDIRNTKVLDIVQELEKYHCRVDIYDPIADSDEVRQNCGRTTEKEFAANKYDVMVFAVAHSELLAKFDQYKKQLKQGAVIYDVKGILPREQVNRRL